MIFEVPLNMLPNINNRLDETRIAKAASIRHEEAPIDEIIEGANIIEDSLDTFQREDLLSMT
jgi:hypothetical protein